MKPKER